MSFVYDKPPQSPRTGTLLTPEMLSENNTYITQQFNEQNSRVIRRWSDNLLFGSDINHGQAFTGSEDLSSSYFYLPPGNQRGGDGYEIDIVIERVQIIANYIAAQGMEIVLTHDTGTETLSLPAQTDITELYTSTNLTAISLLGSDTLVRWEATSDSTWQIGRLQVQVSYRSDRYESSGVSQPSLTLPIFQDQDSASPTQINEVRTNIQTQTSIVRAADSATAWITDIFHNFTSATDAILLQSVLPASKDSYQPPQVIRIWCYATSETACPAGTTVTFQFIVESTTVATVVVNMAGLTFNETGQAASFVIEADDESELSGCFVNVSTNKVHTIVNAAYYIMLI